MVKLKTIKLHGKDYVEVKERVLFFNEEYPNGSITSRIVKCENGLVVIKATVTPDIEKPERIFTGYSYEKENSNTYTKTSYIEICETSAVGRALGFMGIGVVDSIASANEVKNATNQQNSLPQKPQPNGFTLKQQEVVDVIKSLMTKKYFNSQKDAEDWLHSRFQTTKVKDLSDMRADMALNLLRDINDNEVTK